MEEITTEFDKWLTPANDAFNLNLVRPTKEGDPQRIFEEPFHPEFTLEIFPQDETIIGYSDLELNLDFRANDLKPSLRISYGEKWKGVGELKPVDINEALKSFLPPYAFEGAEDNTTGPDAADSSWKPPGKLIKAYSLHGRQFEIWSASFLDPVAREIFRRMLIFIPFFIDGGRRQQLDDQDEDAWQIHRWTLFLTYEVTPLKKMPGVSPYTIVGFATSYKHWIYPTKEVMEATNTKFFFPTPDKPPVPLQSAINPETSEYIESYDPLSAPARECISQFAILPPFQKQSHGSQLYDTMFASFIALPNIYEITVELPNQAFDDMRDWCDLLYLRKLPEFAALALPTTIDSKELAKDAPIPTEKIIGSEAARTALRHKCKIAPRQFRRLVEMQLLSTIPAGNRSVSRLTRKEKSKDENDRRFYFWRLAQKERLYLHNIDSLMQIEADERIERIAETANSVQADWERLLEGAERRAQWEAAAAQDGGSANGGSRGKRRRVVESEEDEEDEEAGERETVAAKRPKVS
ncbi:acyl-CoA N-acyltransferase [Mytilinidion resinicola]|uniref:Histone acetyltransferase type B catalytic subunit n=1 Tax=Mytilinidion resinicola TaxID=574789 RepID=A0A6A6Y8A5_9PEZI|nr:acyl-CoA N-acyltransferase [Mytilinidion resinicola]KAF2804047.1 acyl-CoA N-acyltransferase [Mytilinidion resinicola]